VGDESGECDCAGESGAARRELSLELVLVRAALQRKEQQSLQLSLSVLKLLFAIRHTPSRAIPFPDRNLRFLS
jgi:hypothetical protein